MRVSSANTRLDQVGGNILKAIRHEGFKLLRKGVEALCHSMKLWAERSLS